jgi:RNA polymerase sigma factor FliA
VIGSSRKALSQISFVGLVALDEILATGGERPAQAMAGDPAADRLHDPVEAFEVDQMKVLLADAVNGSGSCSPSTTTRG